MTDLGPAWIAFASGVAGGLLGQIGTWLTLRYNRREAEASRLHEVELAEQERRAAALESTRLYQADTLLELQLALNRLARASTKVMVLQMEHEVAGHAPEDFDISNDLDMACFEAETIARILVTRVDDEEIESLVIEAIELWDPVSTADSWDEARESSRHAGLVTQEALGKIGRALASLPKPQAHQVLVTSPLLEVDSASAAPRSG